MERRRKEYRDRLTLDNYISNFANNFIGKLQPCKPEADKVSNRYKGEVVRDARHYNTSNEAVAYKRRK